MRHLASAFAAFAVTLSFAAVAPAAVFTPGAAGSGDPFFPNAGNGGYDVSSYDLTLDWQPAGNQLTGTAVINAKATQNLSQFDLDLRGFTISRVPVDGAAATFARAGEQELVITPAAGILSGRNFTVTIDNIGAPSVAPAPHNPL